MNPRLFSGNVDLSSHNLRCTTKNCIIKDTNGYLITEESNIGKQFWSQFGKLLKLLRRMAAQKIKRNVSFTT